MARLVILSWNVRTNSSVIMHFDIRCYAWCGQSGARQYHVLPSRSCSCRSRTRGQYTGGIIADTSRMSMCVATDRSTC
eukprot:6197584-Pleurochrysis_carterae.AAC.4